MRARPPSSWPSTPGARVFATAGTEEKLALCRELGADVAINYRDTDFAEVVLAETANRGVDVVFDNVGEAVMEASMKCTAYNGCYVMMGFASNKEVADEPFIVPRRVALGNLKLCGVLLAYAARRDARLVKTAMGWNFPTSEALGARIMREIVALVEQQKVQARRRPGGRLRGDPHGHHGHGQPRDGGPDHRHGRLIPDPYCTSMSPSPTLALVL